MDPLRPSFGTDIFLYLDMPIHIAAPNIVREITEALTAWEERIRVIQVTYELAEAGMHFNIAWEAGGVRATTRAKLIQVPARPQGIGFWQIEFDFVVS